MKIIKKTIKYILLAILGLLAMAAVLLALLQTPPGKKILAELITSLSRSKDGSGGVIKAISGFIPFNFTVDDFRVRDREGAWLELKTISLRMMPLDLLRLKLHAEKIEIQHILLSRLPQANNDNFSDEEEEPFNLRDIPSFLVDYLKAERVTVKEAILGEKIEAALSGRQLVNDTTQGGGAEIVLEQINGEGTQLKLSGKAGPEFSPLSLDLRFEDKTGDLAESLLSEELSGPLTFRLQGDGPLESWKVTLNGQAAGKGTLMGDLLFDFIEPGIDGSLEAKFFTLPGKNLHGEGRANFLFNVTDGKQDLNAQGQADYLDMPWIKTKKIEVSVEGEDIFGSPHGTANIQIANPLIPLGEKVDSVTGGRAEKLSARLNISQGGKHPGGDLKILLSNCSISGTKINTAQAIDLNLTARLDNEKLHASFTSAGESNLVVEAEAETKINLSFDPFFLGLGKDAPLSGNLRSRINLSLFASQLALTRQSLTGQVQTDLTFGGTLSQPEISGQAGLSGGEYHNLMTGTILRELSIKMDGNQDHIALTKLTAYTPGGGEIEMSGRIDVSPPDSFPYIIKIDLSNAELINMETATAALTGKLTLEGAMGKGRLHGSLHIVEAVGRIPKTMPVSVAEIEVIEVNKPGEAPRENSLQNSALLEEIALDIEITAKKGIIIKGRGLDSEWKAEVSITGNAAQPRMKGGIILLQGIFVFMGEELKLKDCSVTMDGRYPPVPQLNINAEFVTSEITIDLQVVGPVSDPKVSLTSQPPYPDDEILAQLLYGRSSDQLTGIQGLQIANGLRVLQGKGGFFDLLTGWTSFLGDIQVDLTELEGNPEKTAVRVRWSVNRNLYVENQQAIDGEGNVLITRWNLGHNLELHTQSGFGLLGDAAYLRWWWDY